MESLVLVLSARSDTLTGESQEMAMELYFGKVTSLKVGVCEYEEEQMNPMMGCVCGFHH